MPREITVRELAADWNVTTVRIYQLIQKGQLRWARPGYLDLDHSQKFRRGQTAAHETRVLFTAHSNGGSVSKEKIRSIKKKAETAKDADDEGPLPDNFFDLPGDHPAAPEAAAAPEPEYAEAMARNLRTGEIKLQLLEEALLAKKQKREHDLGLYVLRREAYQFGMETAKVTGSVLNALPDQIAGIFASDAVHREEVRSKSAEIIERALQTIAQRLESFSRNGGDDV